MDQTRNALRGRIDLPETFEIVQIDVVESLHHLGKQDPHVAEIHEHAEVVQFAAFENHLDAPVVAMDPLALALVAAQPMRGGEFILNPQFIHC